MCVCVYPQLPQLGNGILPASFFQQLPETGEVPAFPKLQLVSLPFSFLSVQLLTLSSSFPAHVPTLLLLSLVWGGRQQGSSFPGCRQGWQPSLRPMLLGLGQQGTPHSWEEGRRRSRAAGSPASLLSCCMILCLLRHSSGLLQGLSTPFSSPDRKKKTEGFLDSIIIPLFIHLKYSKCNYLHNLSQGNECVGGNVSGNVIH